MINLFKKPVEPEMLDSWAKLSDDVAKVAILAIPVVIFAKDNIWFKLLNICLLIAVTYIFLLGGRIFRQMKQGGK